MMVRRRLNLRACADVPGERAEEAFYVPLRVVEVGRDAQVPATYADEDVLLRQPDGEITRGLGAEREPHHVPGPHGRGNHPQAESLCLAFDAVRELPEGHGDVLHAPGEDLAQRLYGHREEYEVAPLADVVASRPRSVRVRVLDQPREVLAALPRDPVVLDGRTLPVSLADVEVTDTVRPEQPLV